MHRRHFVRIWVLQIKRLKLKLIAMQSCHVPINAQHLYHRDLHMIIIMHIKKTEFTTWNDIKKNNMFLGVQIKKIVKCKELFICPNGH